MTIPETQISANSAKLFQLVEQITSGMERCGYLKSDTAVRPANIGLLTKFPQSIQIVEPGGEFDQMMVDWVRFIETTILEGLANPSILLMVAQMDQREQGPGREGRCFV